MKLRLDGIAVDCVIGDLPEERNRLQRLRVEMQDDREGCEDRRLNSVSAGG